MGPRGSRLVQRADQDHAAPSQIQRFGQPTQVAEVTDAPRVIAPECIDLCGKAPFRRNRRAADRMDDQAGGRTAFDRYEVVIADRQVISQFGLRTDDPAIVEMDPARIPQRLLLALCDEPQRWTLHGRAHCFAQRVASALGGLVPSAVDVEVAVADAPPVGHPHIVPASSDGETVAGRGDQRSDDHHLSAVVP